MTITASQLVRLALVGLLGCQQGADTEPAHARRASPISDAPRRPEETSLGLRSLVLQPGEGALGAELHDEVTLIYAARTPDGQRVDGLTTRGRPRRLAGAVVPPRA